MAEVFGGPAQLTINPSGPNPIVLNREDQLDDMRVSLEKDVFELRSLQSSRPVMYIQTGVEMSIEVSVADITVTRKIALLKLAFEGGVEAGLTPNRTFSVTDNAGAAITGVRLLIKPYDGGAVSTVTEDFITVPNAKLIDVSGTEFAYGLSTQQQMRVRFIAAPDATGIKFALGALA